MEKAFEWGRDFAKQISSGQEDDDQFAEYPFDDGWKCNLF